MRKAAALEVLHVTWMGLPEGSLELRPGISSAGCQGQASRAPPPAWPDLPSLGESCRLSLEVGGGAVRASWCPGRRGVTSWMWASVVVPRPPKEPPSLGTQVGSSGFPGRCPPPCPECGWSWVPWKVPDPLQALAVLPHPLTPRSFRPALGLC